MAASSRDYLDFNVFDEERERLLSDFKNEDLSGRVLVTADSCEMEATKSNWICFLLVIANEFFKLFEFKIR